MTKSNAHIANSVGVFLLFILCLLGCTGTDEQSRVADKTKPFAGAVFPASEVCSYQRETILREFGGLHKHWERTTNEGRDSNALYFCMVPESSRQVTGAGIEPSISLGYDAKGGREEGADVIELKFRVWSDTTLKIREERSQRAKIFAPYCRHIAEQALKTALPEKIIEIILNPPRESPPPGEKADPYCEKVGQGFGCVTNNVSPTYNTTDLYLFANEDVYRDFIKR